MGDSCFGEFPSKDDPSKRTKMADWKCRSAELYTKISKVGQGTFGAVYKAEYKQKDFYRLVALKKVLIDSERDGFPITAIREIMIMKRLNHPNILKLIEVVTSPPNEKNKNRGNVYLVFEYMEHDLSGLLRTSIKFEVNQIKCILHQILCGIGYLHKCNIIHRDIKSANILLNSKGEIKIGDFGLGRIIDPASDKRKTDLVVTLWYRAPELLFGEANYGFAVDVWSIGCVFSELLTGMPLFNGKEEVIQVNKIFEKCGTPTEETWPGVTSLPLFKARSPKTIYRGNLRMVYKDNEKVDDVCFDLLNKMLSLDPRKRITVEEALKHPFFSDSHLPKMCKPEELPKFENDSHEYQSLKDYKSRQLIQNNNNNNSSQMRVASGDYRQNQNEKIQNDFLGQKRRPE